MYWNMDHYYEVRKARKEQGLPVAELQETIEDHSLAGKTITEVDTGKVYNVERVYKEWYKGWHLNLLIENNKSHAVVRIDVLTCCDDYIKEQVEASRKRFNLQDI